MKIEDLSKEIKIKTGLDLKVLESDSVPGVLLVRDGYFLLAADDTGYDLEIYDMEDVNPDGLHNLMMRLSSSIFIGNLLSNYILDKAKEAITSAFDLSDSIKNFEDKEEG